MIEVSGLTKTYGNKRGISDITFSIDEGEIVGFLGQMCIRDRGLAVSSAASSTVEAMSETEGTSAAGSTGGVGAEGAEGAEASASIVDAGAAVGLSLIHICSQIPGQMPGKSRSWYRNRSAAPRK